MWTETRLEKSRQARLHGVNESRRHTDLKEVSEMIEDLIRDSIQKMAEVSDLVEVGDIMDGLLGDPEMESFSEEVMGKMALTDEQVAGFGNLLSYFVGAIALAALNRTGDAPTDPQWAYFLGDNVKEFIPFLMATIFALLPKDEG